ncbi:hypothetical protein M1P56_04200 [Streptomyces sp. HU2014]|uniref:hypothetical protein n=1 Tax=Streptomyces sp. HU2014 TaxID=2939414 RepID=UPI00200DCE27|nr:hypothetical protein [Streptomyces sp. HU2014]UQI43624.1 hypothetical protein M1P56_04200 [Streptomyces sp. HU2014]
MADGGWVRVPVGDDAGRWVTRAACRRVLFVVHNVTSATRLLDVLPLFDADPRVQLLVTCTGSSPFLAGVPELMAEAGLPVLPWEQAKATPVDLAVSASYGGELECIQGDLAILSHGIGYNKRLATPDAGRRTPDAGRRTPDAPASASAPAPVFGLAPEWLLHDGRPLAAATVLSHPEQLDRLRAACPEAAATAVLAGDPCFDRILDALPYRERFRRALGVGPGQRLVVVNSTWSPGALFGDGDPSAGGAGGDLLPSLLPRLAAELPADEYRTAAVLHPNIWHGHGPGQVRAWLDRACRAGLTPVPPLEGWRQALIAADCVLGDHGSVTFYAAAIGTPVLLGAFPDGTLDPGSPVAALGRTAPRLRPYDGLRAQLDHVVDTHDPARYRDLAAQVTSDPGRSAELLRRAFYELIGLPEPAGRPALLHRLPLPAYEPAERTAPVRVLTRVTGTGPPEVAVVRYADARDDDLGDSHDPDDRFGWDAHTAVHEDTPDTGRLRLADVILRYGPADDPRLGPPPAWAAEVLGRHPGCGMAVYVTGPGRCVVRTRAGDVLRLVAECDGDGRVDLCDPAAYAAGLYGWLGGKGIEEAVGEGVVVVTGGGRRWVGVERVEVGG